MKCKKYFRLLTGEFTSVQLEYGDMLLKWASLKRNQYPTFYKNILKAKQLVSCQSTQPCSNQIGVHPHHRNGG